MTREIKECEHNAPSYGCTAKPHVHWHRHGCCNTMVANTPENHSMCPGYGITYGGRKTWNCPCECHDNSNTPELDTKRSKLVLQAMMKRAKR